MRRPPVNIGPLLLAAACVTSTVSALSLDQQRQAPYSGVKQRKLLAISAPQQETYSNDLVWELPAGRFNWSGVVPGAGSYLEKAILTLTIVSYYYAAMRLARSQQQANLINSPLTWCVKRSWNLPSARSLE